jgi:hypothetical protein
LLFLRRCISLASTNTMDKRLPFREKGKSSCLAVIYPKSDYEMLSAIIIKYQ